MEAPKKDLGAGCVQGCAKSGRMAPWLESHPYEKGVLVQQGTLNKVPECPLPCRPPARLSVAAPRKPRASVLVSFLLGFPFGLPSQADMLSHVSTPASFTATWTQ